MLKMLKLYKFSAATIKMFNFLATHTSCMQQQHVLVNASELSNINEAETTEKKNFKTNYKKLNNFVNFLQDLLFIEKTKNWHILF